MDNLVLFEANRQHGYAQLLSVPVTSVTNKRYMTDWVNSTILFGTSPYTQQHRMFMNTYINKNDVKIMPNLSSGWAAMATFIQERQLKLQEESLHLEQVEHEMKCLAAGHDVSELVAVVSGAADGAIRVSIGNDVITFNQGEPLENYENATLYAYFHASTSMTSSNLYEWMATYMVEGEDVSE